MPSDATVVRYEAGDDRKPVQWCTYHADVHTMLDDPTTNPRTIPAFGFDTPFGRIPAPLHLLSEVVALSRGPNTLKEPLWPVVVEVEPLAHWCPNHGVGPGQVCAEVDDDDRQWHVVAPCPERGRSRVGWSFQPPPPREAGAS